MIDLFQISFPWQHQGGLRQEPQPGEPPALDRRQPRVAREAAGVAAEDGQEEHTAIVRKALNSFLVFG